MPTERTIKKIDWQNRSACELTADTWQSKTPTNESMASLLFIADVFSREKKEVAASAISNELGSLWAEVVHSVRNQLPVDAVGVQRVKA